MAHVHVYDRRTGVAEQLFVPSRPRDPFPESAPWWAECDVLDAVARWAADRYGLDYYGTCPHYVHASLRDGGRFSGRVWVYGTVADPGPIALRYAARY